MPAAPRRSYFRYMKPTKVTPNRREGRYCGVRLVVGCSERVLLRSMGRGRGRCVALAVFAAPTGRTQKRRNNIMNARMCMFSCVAWLLPADPTSAAVFGLFVALVCHCCCCAAQLVVCAGCRFSSAHLLVCHLLHGPSRVFAVP